MIENISNIHKTYKRIQEYVTHTPIVTSSFLNEFLNCNIYFKIESFQKTGAFKFRGAMNALLSYHERYNNYPSQIVTFSSGNHGQALAHAAQILNLDVRIYTPRFSSQAKIAAAESYGAEVILTESRKEAEERAIWDGNNGYYFLHPFDDEDILLGQGTSCYEALLELINIDAIFATCGGGGWLAGTYLAKEALSPESLLFGVEPSEGNDAYLSYFAGERISLKLPSTTIADGARTSCVGVKTFPYLQKLDYFYMAPEEEIIYWTQWLNHILKIRIEPSSAVTMSGLCQWLKSFKDESKMNKNVLILISGGNIDANTEKLIWQKNMLTHTPMI